MRKVFNTLFFRLTAPDWASFQLVGRGYRVTTSTQTRSLYLKIGYVNKKKIALPESVNIAVASRYEFALASLDQGTLRVLARRIRALRLPNPYTLRGIFLNRESLMKKQGKAVQY